MTMNIGCYTRDVLSCKTHPTPTRGVIMASLMLILEILVFRLLSLDSWLFVTIRAEKKWG
jgi:hypothetical protein